jgi:dihydrolipoamide dehydrogenase
MAESFDVIVVGAGPAGYVAAIRTAQLGLRTAIIDRQWLGGVCLNVGCIPSKALLRNAEIAHLLRERGKEFGFSFDNLTLDYSSAVKRSRLVSDRLVKGVGFLMKKNNITVHIGTAKLSGDVSKPLKAISITDLEGKHTNLSAENIVIATGASAIIPANWKMDGTRVVTYKEAILQERIPASVVIIGAGAIGMEFATVWSSYGADVTVVEMLPHILPLEDSEAAAEVAKAYTKRGVKLLPGHKVEAVEMTKNGVKVTVSTEGASKVLEADQALLAIGFRPNSKELGLEETGVRTSAVSSILTKRCPPTSRGFGLSAMLPGN